MKKLLLISLLFAPVFAHGSDGTVLVIDKLAPKNGAFVGIVDSSQAVNNTTNFNHNLSTNDTTVQKALDTLDNMVAGGSSTSTINNQDDYQDKRFAVDHATVTNNLTIGNYWDLGWQVDINDKIDGFTGQGPRIYLRQSGQSGGIFAGANDDNPAWSLHSEAGGFSIDAATSTGSGVGTGYGRIFMSNQDASIYFNTFSHGFDLFENSIRFSNGSTLGWAAPGVINFTSSMTISSWAVFTGSTTHNGTVNISSGIVLSGSAGTNGQVLTSGGAGTVPTWATPAGSGDALLAATQTWTGANTFRSTVSITSQLNASSATLGGDLNMTSHGANSVQMSVTDNGGFYVSHGGYYLQANAFAGGIAASPWGNGAFSIFDPPTNWGLYFYTGTNQSANRALTIVNNDRDRTMTFLGNPTFYSPTQSPSFAGMTLSTGVVNSTFTFNGLVIGSSSTWKSIAVSSLTVNNWSVFTGSITATSSVTINSLLTAATTYVTSGTVTNLAVSSITVGGSPVNLLRSVALVDASSITFNAGTTDIGILTALSQGSTFFNPVGTPVNGQKFTLRIKSSSARTLSFDTQFRAGTDISLPTTTTGSSKTDYFGFIYDSIDATWDLIASAAGF